MSMCGTSPTYAVKESGRGNRKTWPNDHSPHPPPPPHLPLVRRTGRLPPNTASFSQVRIWCSLVMNPILFSSVRPIERHPPLDHGGHLARRVFLSLFFGHPGWNLGQRSRSWYRPVSSNLTGQMETNLPLSFLFCAPEDYFHHITPQRWRPRSCAQPGSFGKPGGGENPR